MTFDHRPSFRLLTKPFSRRSKRTNKDGKNKKVKSQVLGGVYWSDDANEQDLQGLSKILEAKCESSHSLSTMESCLSDDGTQDGNCGWTSSGSRSHHHGAPLLVRAAVNRRHLDGQLLLSDAELLGRILLRARKTLPKSNAESPFVSNHVMINNERTKRTRAPLRRNRVLDEIAQAHSRKMASNQCLTHPNLCDLPSSHKRLGANVGRGFSPETIHKAMMDSEPDKNNTIDSRFVSMGVGTAKGVDGKLYLCQVFGT